MRLFNLLPVAVLSLTAFAAHADPITYSVYVAFGNETATGTITTDGVQGVLSTSDILTYAITISNGSTSDTVTPAILKPVVFGSDLSANSLGLSFNFSNGPGYFYVEDLTNSGLCFQTSGLNRCFGGLTADSQLILDGFPQTVNLSPLPAYFAQPLVSTPEPSSLALLGTGVLGLGGIVRKRYRRP